MAHYYGIQRSDDYLAHYGIKGMKWGVRKAIERGNDAALRRHYLKASRKLAKLSINANREISKDRYNAAKKRMAVGALNSALGSAALTTAFNLRPGISATRLAGSAGLAGLSAGLAGAAINSKGITARRHISDKGHARAVAKRDAWQKQMRETFKGTQYKQGSIEDRTNDALKKSLATFDPKKSSKLVVNTLGNGSRAAQSNVGFFDRQGNPARINTSGLSSKQQRQLSQGLSKLQNRFEGHYQQGMSRGMTHEQAERYANDRINSPIRKRRRK